AAQPHLRRYSHPQSRSVQSAARSAIAGSEMADPQRAATLRDDFARLASHRRSPAAFLRAWRSGDATDGAARDRGDTRPARVDDLASHDAEVHADAARDLRAQ